jgi:hypothetical protein
MAKDYKRFDAYKRAGRTHLNPEEVAQVLKISLAGLCNQRTRGRGPNFRRQDDGSIVYLVTDVEDYLNGNPGTSTCEASAIRRGFLPAKTITKSRGSSSQPPPARPATRGQKARSGASDG